MALRKSAAKSAVVAPQHSGQMVDEVYRQMFRLEERRPGAEMALALTLLRAWQTTSAGPKTRNELAWLKRICPLCVSMIEDSLGTQHKAHRLDA